MRSSRSWWCDAIWNPVVTPASRIHAIRYVATHLEREHARDVRRKRHRLQVEHQLDVLFIRVGDPGRCTGQFPLLAAAVERFDLLNPTFDLAHVLEVLAESCAIGRTQRVVEPPHRLSDVIQNASILLAARGALLGRCADAEQLIEHQPRIANHRQRLAWRSPADRIGVRARIPVEATAGLIDVLDAQLHRGDWRLLTELLRHQLVERRASLQVRSLRLPRMRLGQKHGRRAEVIAANLRRGESFGVPDVGVADDRDVARDKARAAISTLGDRSKAEPDLSRATTDSSAGRTRSRPPSRAPSRSPRDADCRGVACAANAPRRHHRFEKWHRNRHAHALEHGSARNRLVV